MIRYLAPLVIFIGMVAVFLYGIDKDPSLVPSPLIGKPIPEFELPLLLDSEQMLTEEDIKGDVALLNVWGSYCIPCLQEHPLLMDLKMSGEADIYGLNYADDRGEAIKWLAKHGDPFVTSVFDEDRRVSIDFGVYGVPETYVLDKNGIIKYKHIGALSEEIMQSKILPLIQELNNIK